MGDYVFWGEDYKTSPEIFKIEPDDKKLGEIQEIIEDDENWGEDNPIPPEPELHPVTPRDKFKLAAKILTVAAIMFLIIAVFEMACLRKEGIEKVWNFASVALNSLVSLIVGYYFGSKDKKRTRNFNFSWKIPKIGKEESFLMQGLNA